jgi:hypothetical protein
MIDQENAGQTTAEDEDPRIALRTVSDAPATAGEPTLTGPLDASIWKTVPYPDGAAELDDHLLRLNRLLRRAVERFRCSRPAEQRNGLDGVAIFDDEIDRFLNSVLDPPTRDEEPTNDRRRCESRAKASAEHQIKLPINTIREQFRLSDVEVDALVHCIAAELHPGYGRVFGYLNNDITRQQPSVALIIEVLCPTWRERLEGRRVLSPRSALFRFGLLTASGAGSGHLAAELEVEPSVLEFVLGDRPARDDRRPPTAPGLDNLFLSPEERAAAEQMIGYLGRSPRHGLQSTIIVISGEPGVGRRTCADVICRELGWRLRPIGKGMSAASLGTEIAQSLRDARLADQTPGVYVPPDADDKHTHLPLLIEAAVEAGGLAFMFVAADEAPRLTDTGQAEVLRLHLSAPRAGVRSRVWKQALDRHGLLCSEEVVSRIGAIYPFTVSRIYACAREAGLRTQVGLAGSCVADITALAQICRAQVRHHLERLAQPVPSRHGWDDIVLPPDELCRLKEIASAVRNRDRVMQEWGFGRKLSAGPGVNAIFFGPSGTGKTMAASILAGDLGIALYRVDLSRVVSKYIGETERNLDALFEEARRSFAMLLFDEAEALFGKRSEVKDAHDRYANIEVAYLLQRMEQFEGIAILATNLRKHLDTAFLRRLQFAVEFPLPTMADRLRIWRRVWPGNATLDSDVDLEFMAAHLELSGGHIRNVALMAAYLAAEEASPISMRHLIVATRRELQKLGRGCVPGQFGPYASLFQDGPTP